MKTFKTPKGTELPLLNLKGKDYLEVKYRLVWFREDRPDWGIATEFLRIGDNEAVARATITDANGRLVAQGTKSETQSGFPDFIEKSESGAIGRALAHCGYGTQFAQELEEGERLVDSPAVPKGIPSNNVAPLDPGAYIIKCGKKYPGTRLDAIGPHDCASYADWLRKSAAKGQALTGDFLECVNAIDAFVRSRELPKTK